MAETDPLGGSTVSTVADLNEQQFADHLDLYHRTSPEAAEAIRAGRSMTSKERGVSGGHVAFFSTNPGEEQTSGYGSAVVHVRVPAHMASLEDEFPSGEQHYSVPVKKLRPEHFV